MSITKRKNGSYILTGDDADNFSKALRGDDKVALFNLKYSVGDEVRVKDDDGNEFLDKIRYPASILGGHTAVAWLETKGSYLLGRVVGKAS